MTTMIVPNWIAVLSKTALTMALGCVLAGCGGNAKEVRTVADDQPDARKEAPRAGAGERTEQLPPAEEPSEAGDW